MAQGRAGSSSSAARKPVIEVTIKHVESKRELARITIENTGGTTDKGDYSIRIAADRVGAVGIIQRGVYGFPRLRYNVLALLLQALKTLDEDELRLEDEVGPSDMAREQRRVGSALQAWTSRLHHH